METMYRSSSSLSTRQDGSVTYDELSMQQSLLFSDSLKDLKNLRSQLYSAAEYFELSYTQDDQKQIVVNSLKDYAVKALVNTVDHLGSVSYKVNGLLDEKFDEVCGTEFLVSCIEQRLRTCQQLIDEQGLSQQSLMITAPKYHKHYILPVGETILVSPRQAVPEYQELKQTKEKGELKQLQTAPAVHSTISGRTPSFRKLLSISPSPRARSPSPSQKGRSPSPSFPGKFSFKEKRTVSPLPTSNPLARSGSLSRSSINPNPSNIGRPYPLEPQKSASMRLHAERNDNKETQQTLTKSRSILKALLSRRRSRKDDTMYSYLNEY